MNKKECEDALNQIEESYYNSDNSFGAMKQFKKDVEVLNILITDHFENKPLEFEELKEGMWVWNDVEKEFLKVKCVCVADEDTTFFKEGTKIIEFVFCGISSRTVDVEFEPNRFYRKQVKE